jgi:cell fate (sporulation/competence/biofilm development) regulator YlbF (YheA/YmcA/DUF963 family)
VNDVLKLADELGKAIADSPAGKAMADAQTAFRADEQSMKLMAEYQKQAEKLARLEQEGKPIEVADKHALEALEARLAANQSVKRLTEAQMDYFDLIRKVNDAIQGPMAEREE